jgi:predicted 2-oxoglutarate/Fe(II)-dependent dioxygenase YbiX
VPAPVVIDRTLGANAVRASILSSSVFTIPQFLSIGECESLVQLAEQAGFSAAEVRMNTGQKSMPNVRNNERTTVENPAWVALLWQRLSQVNLPGVDGEQAVGLPKDLRFYKYGPGQRFKMHKDGPWHEQGLSSQLTFLIYLNEGFVGGATDFKEFQVVPTAGTALVFVHDTWHEGAEVTDGTKYVLRSDVLFSG